jgi:phenylpropionate dioxygenase-like ring-hydroxylating dioxygenase large terminal subunit
VISTPVNASQTRVIIVRRLQKGGRGSPIWRPAKGAGHPVLDEDRRIVESQHGAVALDDSEVSVGTDGPSILFRRWYRDLLRTQSH